MVGFPAARLTDLHLCPMVTGIVPHVGGPITSPGATTVLIGKLPAARALDVCTCIGPPDVIAQGSTTVLSCKMPQSRILDTSLHGGMIILGCFTVLVGGAAANMQSQAAAIAAHNGSTRVYVDPITKTVYITTNMEYSGPGATQAYADAAKKQIEDTWSGTMTVNGETYAVNVQVNTKVNTSGTATAGYDQITVDPAQNRMDQSLYGNGEGRQTPAAATDAGRPRRIAHEYGHTLGLDDDYHDTPTGTAKNPGAPPNDIMAETWPAADGTLPHPHQSHYDQVLKNHGY
ncbi:PAAR domain-containing protein [Neoroseomonas lacus]|uniref:Zn-binding Pro-Ala-Ala-Arg (PAAR) domain-containing protein, incolved in TypeVI secretion n=1 Tax=Neoroseomonas lacus TaxID=287609 RepID=A0A917KG83_9PROT|nr:PAAR domain-containing protein [Neoroseomonas lacus]GGJ10501.1 hypothetical protein GCM10011320_17030 [Neoroseomonas lacus]